MNSSALPYWLTMMVLLGASYAGWKWWQVRQYQAAADYVTFEGPPLENFELTERSGQPFRSEEMRGKVWVTTFFFTTCPGACPRLNASIRHLNSLEELREVVWLSISVDPDIDTLPVLREYADSYQADPERWLFCRGDLAYISRIGKEVMKLPIGWRGHNDYAVVIDRQGEARGMFDATSKTQSERLRLLLLECLQEPYEPPATSEATPPDGVQEPEDSRVAA